MRLFLFFALGALVSWIHDLWVSSVGTPEPFDPANCKAYLEMEYGSAISEPRELEEGERLHIDGEDCWCHPYVYFEADNGNKVWIHKGNGDELPPAKILAEAIADAIADKEN